MRFCGDFNYTFLRYRALPRLLECFDIRSDADINSQISVYTMSRDNTLDRLKRIEETHLRGFYCPFQWATLLSSNQRAIVMLRAFLRAAECGLRLYGRRASQGLQYTIMPESTHGLRRMYKRHGTFRLFA